MAASAGRHAVPGEKRRAAPGGRTVSYRITLSDEEARRLAAMAEDEGVTVARLMTETTLTGQLPSERRELLALLLSIRRDLSQLGNNVNQIARLGNTTGRPVAFDDLPDRIREMVGRVQECITGAW